MTRLSDRTLRLIGYGLIAVVSAAALTTAALSLSIGETGRAVEQAVLVAVFAPVLFILVRVQPRNRAIWTLLAGSALGASQPLFSATFEYRWGMNIETVLAKGLGTVAPADLELVSSVALFLGSSTYLMFFVLTIHFLVLFPDGRSPSMPWRVVLWLSAAMMIAPAVWSARYLAPWVDRPYDPATIDVGAFEIVTGTAATALLIISAAAVMRAIWVYRRSSAVERLQFRWLIWAVALNVIPWAGVGDAVSPVLASVGSTLALAAVPVAVAIAITKYRLYDIDLVISRSLLFIGLVGFITIVYAAVVSGVGSVVGGTSLGWSIAATAIVAIVFEPVRHRLQRWINRLVYGQRATPYEVLADLTGRLARTEREEGILDRMAQRVAEGTGANQVTIWSTTDTGTGFHPVAWAPGDTEPTQPTITFDDLPGTAVPIEHDGQTLGAITVESRRGESLSVTERRLVDDLCGSAGLIMRRRRLDDQLEEKAEQLEESRRRLVSAQDDERRRLEQQLNHGPKQQIVALRTQLATTEQYGRTSGINQIADFLAQMVTETQDAINQIQALALGIYPPLLETEGLATAVNALADSAPVDIAVDNQVGHRHPLPLEAAAYFCISEAVTNAIKHGTPPLSIELTDHDDELAFTVTDTGPGFDPATVTRGSGLNNLDDRLDALNGTITIDSTPGHHTVIRGRVPVNRRTATVASPPEVLV